MDVRVDTTRRFRAPAPIEDVFTLLADVPRSVGHYPDVALLHPLGDGAYRWELAKLGAAGISHQVIYACRYVSDPSAKTVTWHAVPGVGNGIISGQWKLTADGDGTWIDFRNEGSLTIPVPRMLKRMAGPFVRDTFERQIDTYMANLGRTFEALG
jgi:carbon monoxide dehydrogenase subunit G